MDVVTPAYRGASAIAQLLPGAVIDVMAPLLGRVFPPAKDPPRRARPPAHLRGLRARRAGAGPGNRTVAGPAPSGQLGVVRLLAHPGEARPGHGGGRAARPPARLSRGLG